MIFTNIKISEEIKFNFLNDVFIDNEFILHRFRIS